MLLRCKMIIGYSINDAVLLNIPPHINLINRIYDYK